MQVLDTIPSQDTFLPPFQRVRSVRDALDYLYAQQSSITILSCYAHYFPSQWATATNATTPGPDHAYAPREWEFFKLVHRHLFPLNLDWLEMQDDEGLDGRDLDLPVERGGLDWWECRQGELDPGWELLLQLDGEWLDPDADDEADEADDEANDPDDDLDDDPDADPSPTARAEQLLQIRSRQLAGHPLDATRLQALAAAAGPPLSGLPAALAMIRHNTGSAWLDAGPEAEMDLRWNIPDVDYMIDDYQTGRAIYAQALTLIAWLAAPYNCELR